LRKKKKAVAVNRLDILSLDPRTAAVFEVQVKKIVGQYLALKLMKK